MKIWIKYLPQHGTQINRTKLNVSEGESGRKAGRHKLNARIVLKWNSQQMSSARFNSLDECYTYILHCKFGKKKKCCCCCVCDVNLQMVLETRQT